MANIFAFTLLFCYIGTALSVDIATYARYQIGSTHWSRDNYYETNTYTANSDTDKAHLFVYDVLDYCGVSAPVNTRGCGGGMHHGMMGRMGLMGRMHCNMPIGPSDWGNMYCRQMSNCWVPHSNTYERQLGDVISDGTHVAIVTGRNMSTGTNNLEVVENAWGFRDHGEGSFNSITATWHYSC